MSVSKRPIPLDLESSQLCKEKFDDSVTHVYIAGRYVVATTNKDGYTRVIHRYREEIIPPNHPWAITPLPWPVKRYKVINGQLVGDNLNHQSQKTRTLKKPQNSETKQDCLSLPNS